MKSGLELAPCTDRPGGPRGTDSGNPPADVDIQIVLESTGGEGGLLSAVSTQGARVGVIARCLVIAELNFHDVVIGPRYC